MKEAAERLHAQLRHERWHVTTGVDAGFIAVWVEHMPTGKSRSKIPRFWEGFDVRIKYAKRKNAGRS